MLYLIGLGLNEESYSRETYNVLSKADKIYIENYTADYPYDIKQLEKQFRSKKFIVIGREFVEQDMHKLIEEAKNKDIALLIYGSPLTATTHISLIQEAKKQNIKVRVIYNASVLDAVAETGLQLYKFGKVASIPNFEAESFIETIKDNLSIGAHTLVLVDIGMEAQEAFEKLEKAARNHKVKLNKIVVCSRLGTKDSQIYYKNLKELQNKNIKKPFCIILPGKMHFMEKEILEDYG